MLEFDFSTVEIETPAERRLRERGPARERMRRQYREGRYKRSRSSRGGIKATLMELPICAIDGEGKTRLSGKHDYTLLCASWPDDKRQIAGLSLSSMQCFEFLLSMPENHVYVGYGLSYDMNMWLRDLPHKNIDQLLDHGETKWRQYRIAWIERKYFDIRAGKRHTRIYDVMPNWQLTFVEACARWSIGQPCLVCGLRLHRDPTNHSETDLDSVLRMKQERGRFNGVTDAAIEDYCYLECDLLRKLSRALFDAILQTEYRPRAVYGPGALASAALEREGVKRYMAPMPDDIEPLTRFAYFGGRFDTAILGWFLDAYLYDIKSAYPDQIRGLPCLKHATWQYEKAGFERIRARAYGLYHVMWEVPPETIWPPFPHRTPLGMVYYPYTGEGWYHGDEVEAATALYGSDCIRILEGWHLVRGCEHKPFAFVDRLYDLRMALDASGEVGKGIVIKLILNSLYGKLAQQVGGHNGKPPPFQCFYWAGAITAGTRAKILRGLAACPESVIGIATDSLVSLRELDLDLGSALGQWEYKHLREYAALSNGVYRAIDADGKTIERARGLGRYELDYDAVKRDFIRSQATGSHTFLARTRFITLREARQRTDRDELACRWVGPDTPNKVPDRVLNFFPARRFPGEYSKQGPTRRLEPLAPDDYGAPFESQPFRKKVSWREVMDARERHNPIDWLDGE